MNSLATALVQIRRSPYQSMAAVLVLSITFFVGYSFSLFAFGIQQVLTHFETQPQVIAFFQLDATDQQIAATKSEVEQKEYVEQITIIDKNQALEIYQQSNQDDPLLLELVSADILPASIEVSGVNVESLPQIRSDLEQLDSIDEVVLQESIVDSLKVWTKSVRLIGLGSVLILSLTSLLIIMVITGMKISAKRNAINIMHIIGASRWYIKSPYLIEGAIYSLAGSILGWLAMYTGLLYLTPWLQQFVNMVPLLPVPWAFLGIQFGVGSSLGLLLSVLASGFAVSRVLRR